MPKCNNCHKSDAQGARFAHKAKDGKLDTLCVSCRFNEIDGRASASSGIHDDMRRTGIPVARAARKLKFD